MRLIVTGSRDWTDSELIYAAMGYVKMAWVTLPSTRRGTREEAILVHGACPTGADDIADRHAMRLGWNVERHPAQWSRYGKRAGYIRNAEMVEAGAEVCLAFIRNNSRGATMCADLAERAGIPTHRFTEETK
jgi:hypothetical protein